MFYHVRITQKSNKAHDEVKLDLSKEKLFSQFIDPYNKGNAIIINGKTILPQDLERIRITETDRDSNQTLPEVRHEREQSNVIAIGISDEWYVADNGKDITDELIKGAPGYKKTEKESESKKIEKSNRTFIVHGNDETARETTARFVEKLGLEAVILHEQPNKGRTIIEKFEDYADVSFAVILLTPDDVGAPSQNPKNLQPRARQNVIFELGYFIGALGRERVVALYKKDVEIPSDYQGVLFIPFDRSEAWKINLAKELKTAGMDIDLHRAV